MHLLGWWKIRIFCLNRESIAPMVPESGVLLGMFVRLKGAMNQEESSHPPRSGTQSNCFQSSGKLHFEFHGLPRPEWVLSFLLPWTSLLFLQICISIANGQKLQMIKKGLCIGISLADIWKSIQKSPFYRFLIECSVFSSTYVIYLRVHLVLDGNFNLTSGLVPSMTNHMDIGQMNKQTSYRVLIFTSQMGVFPNWQSLDLEL